MFDILSNIVACMLWGAIISIGIVIGLYVAFRVLIPSWSLSLSSALTLFMLFLFLFVQSFLLTGAIYAKGYADDLAASADRFIDQKNSQLKVTTAAQQSQQLKQTISEQYPVLKPFLRKTDNAGIDQSDITGIARKLKSLINGYILRRVLWMAGFITAGTILLLCMKPRYNKAAFQTDIDSY